MEESRQFPRTILPPFSGSNSKPRKKPVSRRLGLLVDPEMEVVLYDPPKRRLTSTGLHDIIPR
jgi:hypothetical protein